MDGNVEPGSDGRVVVDWLQGLGRRTGLDLRLDEDAFSLAVSHFMTTALRLREDLARACGSSDDPDASAPAGTGSARGPLWFDLLPGRA